MTELMKRPPELQPVTVPQFVVNEYNQLKLENVALKDQLRWRPVSEELPSVEKDGAAIIASHKDVDKGLVPFDCVSTMWFLNNYKIWFTHWLPIPPAPEGE